MNRKFLMIILIIFLIIGGAVTAFIIGIAKRKKILIHWGK